MFATYGSVFLHYLKDYLSVGVVGLTISNATIARFSLSLRSNYFLMGIIQRQGIKNLITTYSGFAVGFINLMILQPRFLTPEELGLTRILFSFSMLLAMFVPMGIGNATTRFFSLFKDSATRHHGYFGFMLLFPLVGYAITFVLLWLLKGFFIGQYAENSPLFAEFFVFVFPFILILALLSCFNIYAYVLLKTTVPSFINDVFTRVMVMVLVTVYYLRWISLDVFIGLFVGIYALQLIILSLYIWWEEPPGFRIDWQFFRLKGFRQLFTYGIILWFAALASLGLKELGVIVLGKYMQLEFVAIYTIAAFISTLIEAPLFALEKIATPKISFAWNDNNRKELLEIYEKSTHYMLLVGGLLFLGVNLNITELLHFLPPAYRDVEPIVLVISVSALINMATGLNASIIFYSEKYRYGAITLILLVFVSLGLQVMLIPRFGLAGAAWATAISGVLYNVANYLFVYKLFDLQPFRMRSLKVAALVAVLFIVFRYVPASGYVWADLAWRSVLITGLYAGAVAMFHLAPELLVQIPIVGKYFERKGD